MGAFVARRGKAPENASPVFANNTWADIIRACQTRRIPAGWIVGDRKNMTINGTDYDVQIIGKDHDEYADGTGIAPVTFQLRDCHNVTYQMDSINSNQKGWTSCDMRITHLPLILSTLPAEVGAAIREVSKQTSQGNYSATIEHTSDKLFLLSEVEVTGRSDFSNAGNGKQYEFYASGGTKQKTISGQQVSWWLRSPYKNGNFQYCVIANTGASGYSGNTTDLLGVSYAFCF